MKPVQGGMPDILEEINYCVGEGGSFILDRADERLAIARKQRKENYAALTKQAEEIARSLFASKAAETSQVIVLPVLIHLNSQLLCGGRRMPRLTIYVKLPSQISEINGQVTGTLSLSFREVYTPSCHPCTASQ